MSKFDELLQNYVNSDYEVLVNIAREALGKVLPTCQAVDPDNKGMLMLSSIILSAVGADGVLTAKEREFLRDVLGLDDEQISKYIKMYDSNMVDLVNNFADKLSDDVKTQTLTLIICVAACDEKISREETAFIRKILD